VIKTGSLHFVFGSLHFDFQRDKKSPASRETGLFKLKQWIPNGLKWDIENAGKRSVPPFVCWLSQQNLIDRCPTNLVPSPGLPGQYPIQGGRTKTPHVYPDCPAIGVGEGLDFVSLDEFHWSDLELEGCYIPLCVCFSFFWIF
jgi:hypothetical protein